MSAASKRFVWWPFAFTVAFVVLYLAPIPRFLFELHLERFTGMGIAPAFLVYREFSSMIPFSLPSGVRSVFQVAVLVLVSLFWFTFILLPFWSDFRVGRLSSRSSRLLFAGLGVVLTVICWLHLGGWRTIDE